MNEADVAVFHKTSGFSCNVYILNTAKGAILIDPGFYDYCIQKYLCQCGGLNSVLLTHGHWDHIKGLDALLADFPDAKVFHHELDEGFLTDPVLNCTSGTGIPLICKTTAQALVEGEYEIAGKKMQVFHTPGHTIGSCIYYFPEDNILFSGDSFLLDQPSPTYRPTGSQIAMIESIRKIKNIFFHDNTLLYCGHFENGTYKELLKKNPDFRGGKFT